MPTAVFMIYALIVYATTSFQDGNLAKDQLANRWLFNQVKAAEDGLAVVVAVFYWVLGFRRIRNYRTWLFGTQSDSRLAELTWLRNLLLVSGILVLALTAVVLLNEFSGTGPHHFFHLQAFYLYITGLIYYLSFQRPKILFSNLPKSPDATPEYEDAVIDEDIKARLLLALETDKVYLNPELSLKILAQHMGCPVGIVSAAINQGFAMNFRNLVNNYRVQEIKRRLLEPPSHLSILGVALECGFNSEASFYRIFRKGTGMSPNDYLQLYRK